MRILKNYLKCRRGFTMAEVIIAFAIISVVSIATLSLVFSSFTATKNANNRLDAQNYAEDVIECYRVTDSEAEFQNAVTFALGQEYTGGAITLDGSGYILTIDYSREKVEVTVSRGDKQIVEASFSKGGAGE